MFVNHLACNSGMWVRLWQLPNHTHDRTRQYLTIPTKAHFSDVTTTGNSFFLSFLFCFFGAGDWTPGLMHVKHEFSTTEPYSIPYTFLFLWDGGLAKLLKLSWYSQSSFLNLLYSWNYSHEPLYWDLTTFSEISSLLEMHVGVPASTDIPWGLGSGLLSLYSALCLRSDPWKDCMNLSWISKFSLYSTDDSNKISQVSVLFFFFF